jgi:hypothetical protein
MEYKNKPVTHGELEVILKKLSNDMKSIKKEINIKKGWANIGEGISYVIKNTFKLTLYGVAIGYATMSFSYGPYDTAKVIYDEILGKNSIKEKEFAQAKYIYATKILEKNQLNNDDINDLFRKLEVIHNQDENYKETLEQVSWNKLLDFNEEYNTKSWYSFK